MPALAGIAARAASVTSRATKLNKASSQLRTGADFQLQVESVADVIADASNTFAVTATGGISAGGGVVNAGRDIARAISVYDQRKQNEEEKAAQEYEQLKNTNVKMFVQDIEF